MNIILNRDPFDPAANRTFGEMIIHDAGLCFATIERAWNDNKGDIAGVDPVVNGKQVCGPTGPSCIYPGVYDLVRHVRPGGTHCFALVNPDLDVYYLKSDIPQEKIEVGRGRYLVLIHAGNFVTDIIGCIAPGMKRARFMNKDTGRIEDAVASSGAAMNRIMHCLEWGDGLHTIDIRQANAPALYN